MKVSASVTGPHTLAISGREGNSEEYDACKRNREIIGFAWISGSVNAARAVGRSFVPGTPPTPRANFFCSAGAVMNLRNSNPSSFTGLSFQIAKPFTPRTGRARSPVSDTIGYGTMPKSISARWIAGMFHGPVVIIAAFPERNSVSVLSLQGEV